MSRHTYRALGWGFFGSGGGVLCATLGRPGLGAGRGFLVPFGLAAVANEPDDVSEGLDDVAPLGPGAGVPANVPYFMSYTVTRVSLHSI